MVSSLACYRRERLVFQFAQAPDDPQTDQPEHAHDALNQKRDGDTASKCLWQGDGHQAMEKDSHLLLTILAYLV